MDQEKHKELESVAEEQPEVEEELVPDPPEAIDKAERLLREANLAKVKGLNSVADRLMKEAMETAPNSAEVLEAIGDDYVARGQFRRAKEAYAKAKKINPSSASLENKFGEMVLRVDLHIDPFTAQDDFAGYASPKVAVILSLLCAGLGQMAVERYVKGGIMMAVYIGALTLINFVPGGWANFTGKVAFDPLSGLLLGVAIFTLLWSVFDLATLRNRPMPKTDRPIPPVDGF